MRLGPPSILTNPMIAHTYRFSASSAFSVGVTAQGLCGIAGAVGRVSNSAVQPVVTSVKVHRISIWAPPGTQGGVASVLVQMTTIDQGLTKEYSNSSMSTAYPAYLSVKPTEGTLAYQWNKLSTNVLFYVAGPAGSIVDINMTSVMNDSNAITTDTSVSTATVGVMYYLALDNPSGHLLVPVYLGTTF
jgi:hypothetical protein